MKSMFEGLAFALASLLLGAVLLYDAVFFTERTQTAGLIAGAVFLALGLVTISLLAKNWWELKHNKKVARSVPHWPSQD